MQYTRQIISAVEFQSPLQDADNDDIEAIFGKLQKIEPPASLVSNILSSISKLPKDIHTRKDISDFNVQDYIEKREMREDGWLDQELEGFIIRKDSCEAC